MIAAWMAYSVVVGFLLAAAGFVTERIARPSGAPTRWIWGLAMTAALAWPLLAGLVRSSDTSPAVGAPATSETPGILDPALIGVVDPLARRAASLDPVLLWLWVGASVMGVAILVWTDQRTRRIVSRLPAGTVAGFPVRFSCDLGPAVIGWPAGSIVVPRWTAELAEAERDLIIAHEAQHQRARDSLLLGTTAIAVALVPWNLPMWWMVRRLRAAVEFDCDARVLRGGTAPARYAALLCAIAARPRRPLSPALAISHPTSLLARRIDHMLKPIVRAHPGLLMITGLAVSGFIVAACEVPTPPAEEPAANYEFQTAEQDAAKQDLATAHAQLRTFQREIERLVARGARDPSSELHGELEALLTRARQSREGITRRLSETGGAIEGKPSSTFQAAERAGEVRRMADLHATERAMRAEKALGSVVRLREVAPQRADAGDSPIFRFMPDQPPTIYVDGLRVTNVDDLSPESIERIEVVKGGEGAGTINIFTKR